MILFFWMKKWEFKRARWPSRRPGRWKTVPFHLLRMSPAQTERSCEKSMLGGNSRVPDDLEGRAALCGLIVILFAAAVYAGCMVRPFADG